MGFEPLTSSLKGNSSEKRLAKPLSEYARNAANRTRRTDRAARQKSDLRTESLPVYALGRELVRLGDVGHETLFWIFQIRNLAVVTHEASNGPTPLCKIELTLNTHS